MERLTEHSYEGAGGTVRYWTGGVPAEKGAPTLVFLHGLTADHTMFDAQVEAFADRFPLLVWDAPGHGDSRPYEPVSMIDAADCMAGIMRSEGIDSAIVVGQSLGGMIAQYLYARVPTSVRGIVGIDTTPIDTLTYCTAFDRWLLRQVGWMAKLYTWNGLLKAVPKTACTTPAGRDNMRAMMERLTKAEYCRLMGDYYRSLVAFDGTPEPECPILLLVGDDDRVGKVWEYNKAWVAHEGHTLYVIKDAGHNSNVDNPEAVNKRIERFIEDVR